MTVFHLLRHGEHGLLGRVLAGRMPGVGMTERGRAEIAAAAERFAREKIAAIYASPLQRTRESAEIVAMRLGLPITFRDDLLELDFGEWTGATFDSIRSHPAWQAWNTQRSLARIPGGESMREVQHRSVEALVQLTECHLGETVVVVCHGDVIRAMLLFALGMPLDFYNRIEVVQGSISSIQIEPDRIRVHVVDDVETASTHPRVVYGILQDLWHQFKLGGVRERDVGAKLREEFDDRLRQRQRLGVGFGIGPGHDNFLTLQAAFLLHAGHQVGHGLAGVVDITLHVDDGNTRMLGYVAEIFVALAPIAVADGDTMPIGRENFANLFGCITVGDLHFVRFQENSMAAQPCHACLEGVTRAR